MPRRNRNANAITISRDMLADQLAHLARELAAPLLCAACMSNPATEGDYCVPCEGLIIFAARRDTLERR